MSRKSMMSLALAAGCVLALGAAPPAHAQSYNAAPMPMPYNPPPQMETNGPQASAGDFGDWSARRNVMESHQYDRLLETNLAFRGARERKECGPISDAQLHDQCMASFQQYEPTMYGSSEAPWRYRYHRGAGN